MILQFFCVCTYTYCNMSAEHLKTNWIKQNIDKYNVVASVMYTLTELLSATDFM